MGLHNLDWEEGGKILWEVCKIIKGKRGGEFSLTQQGHCMDTRLIWQPSSQCLTGDFEQKSNGHISPTII